MTECFVGFDTSNYTTSVAACDREGKVFANLKMLLPVESGNCGLRQSDAVFAHVRNLPELLHRLRPFLEDKTVLAVGVSEKPRRAQDSYMPCFLSGVSAATAFATALSVPLFRFSHQDGHIMAALFSSDAVQKIGRERFVAFHVSGGTTDVVLAQRDRDGFDVSLLGQSLDLHAGQAIDRAGVMMGLQFPCGKELEKDSDGFDGTAPKPKVSVEGCSCHLSGLQNQVEKLWRETGDKGLVSRYVLDFLGKTLQGMTAGVDTLYPGIPIVYAGGVMSNRYLQKMLASRPNTFFSEPAFSADNAAGIALLCRENFLKSE